MKPIKIFVASGSYLFTEGIDSFLNQSPEFQLIGSASDENILVENLIETLPDVLTIDLSSFQNILELLSLIKQKSPSIRILAFNTVQPKHIVSMLLNNGVTSYLLLCCDKQEITEALHKTNAGERFLCGQVLDVLVNDKPVSSYKGCPLYSVCEGVKISERELEIIRCISDGLSNQQIADKLFLSVHTVNTHRKNIMGKLGINNTAGLVMYAVKSQLLNAN